MTFSSTGGCTEPGTASAIVRAHLDETLSVVDTRPLHGGMVSRVEEWITDGEPAAIVAKVTAEADNKGLCDEHASLDWCVQHTSFPMPKPYACVSSTEEYDGTVLLMERLPGHNLLTEVLPVSQGAQIDQINLKALAPGISRQAGQPVADPARVHALLQTVETLAGNASVDEGCLHGKQNPPRQAIT